MLNNLPEGPMTILCREHHAQYPLWKQQQQQMTSGAETTVPTPGGTQPSPGNDTENNNMHPTPASESASSMTVATVSKKKKGKSPIISTANKCNELTMQQQKIDKKGNTKPGAKKKINVYPNRRVRSLQSSLITKFKQGDPQFEIIDAMPSHYYFYGTAICSEKKKKGCWRVRFDELPDSNNIVVCHNRILNCLPKGAEEPRYDPNEEAADKVINRLGVLESDEESDFDLLLDDDGYDGNDDIDDDATDAGGKQRANKQPKKKSRKVLKLEKFLAMDDDDVRGATSFDHFHGEGDGDFIRWDILRVGEEITVDVMQHPDDKNPFLVNIPWFPQVERNDYFGIFFQYFFPPLKGKAALMDKYLSDPRASYHTTAKQKNIKFHQPNRPDPDYIVSILFVLRY